MAQERAERAKARRKSVIERQPLEAVRSVSVNESCTRIASLDFSENTEGA